MWFESVRKRRIEWSMFMGYRNGLKNEKREKKIVYHKKLT